MKHSKKKNLIFTGGSKGIGYYLLKYLSQNFICYNLSRSKSGLKNVIDIKCDVSKINEIKKAFQKIKNAEFLINCAAITIDNKKNIIQNFSKIIQVNLNGTFFCCNEAKKIFKKNKSSSIINFASINGYVAFPNNPGYVTSKGGVLALTRSLALDYSKYNIRVNSISPGYIKEGMAKQSFEDVHKRKARTQRMITKRFGEPSDLIGVIDLLMSERSSYINGQDIVVDGGWLAKGL